MIGGFIPEGVLVEVEVDALVEEASGSPGGEVGTSG